MQGDPRRVRGRLGVELGFTAVAAIAVAIYGLGGLSLRSLLPADPA